MRIRIRNYNKREVRRILSLLGKVAFEKACKEARISGAPLIVSHMCLELEMVNTTVYLVRIYPMGMSERIMPLDKSFIPTKEWELEILTP